jgi:hypothetical protein
MSTLKHTPGPWHTDGDVTAVTVGGYETTRVAVSGNGQAIALVYAGFGNGPENARLIAAAPRLLAALREVYTLMANPSSSAMYKARDVVRAAICEAVQS